VQLVKGIDAMDNFDNFLFSGQDCEYLDVETYHRFKTLVEESLIGICIIKNYKLAYMNPKFAETFGYCQDEMIDKDILKLIYHEDIEKVSNNINRKIEGKIRKIQYEFRGVTKKGSVIHLETLGSRVNFHGVPSVLGTLVNISEYKKVKEQLRMAHKVFANTIEGVVVTDSEGNIEWVNPAFTVITGYNAEEAIGKNPRILKSKRHTKEFYKNMWDSLIENGQWQGEIWNRKKGGETYPEWLTISAIRDDRGNVVQYVSIFNDITERIKQEESIKYQANHDALTGLPNRFLYKDRMLATIAHAHRYGEKFAVILLGLDRFKRVNDTLGHASGDKLLIAVAARLSEVLQEDDTVARFSGDTFGIILKEVKNVDKLMFHVNEIFDKLNTPFNIDEHTLHITASMGISLYPLDGIDCEALIKNADTAMHRAKELGTNSYQIYTHSMNEKAHRWLSMENEIHKALERDEFILHYQPQVDIKTGRIVGAEALVRWIHPKSGFVSPGEFIPLAEETGLIIPLGEWVLNRACSQNKEWQDKGLPKILMSVNLSTVQFKNHNLISGVKEILNVTKLSSQYLELEITESNAMLDADFTNKKLCELKEMGIRIAIDDFGTGYSSLAYLSTFPIDKIKIDQSFVKGIPQEKEMMAIVKAIIAMSKSLDIKTIAEGVETKEQIKCLEELHCNEIQGYFYSKPVEPEVFEKLLMSGYIKK
jgi:diguanylate cyclase (GGDEF)-like protein/PAS domain S-box-containing protein